jgi:hypothetical protein
VVGDSERSLRGSVRLRVTQNGLEVWQGETLDLLIPLGTPAEADGARVRVQLDGRRLELQVARGFGMSSRLAHDLAEFLEGRRRSLLPHKYQAPVGLLWMALLPLGIGVLAPSAWVWWAVAAGVAGLCLSLAWVDAWSRPARLATSAGLAGAGYLAVVLLAVVPRGGLFGPDRVPDSEWTDFTAPSGRYTLRFPGRPVPVQQPVAGLNQPITLYQVERRNGKATFQIGETRVVARPGDLVNEDLSPEQRFAGSLQGILARTPGGRLVSQRDLSLQGWPGREFVV